MRGAAAPYAPPPYSWWITMIPSLGFPFSNFPDIVTKTSSSNVCVSFFFLLLVVKKFMEFLFYSIFMLFYF
jgi:hypothetical protein